EIPVAINTEDATLPHIVIGHDNQELLGAVVIINSSEKELTGLNIKSSLDGQEITTKLPAIPPMTSRKVPFKFNGSSANKKAAYTYKLDLTRNNQTIDTKEI